jgi:hypothetical protein
LADFIKVRIERLPTRKARARIVLLSCAAVLTLVLAAGGTTAAQGEPNKEQYELQKRCGKDAAVFFARFDKEEYPQAVSFTNHYNPDLTDVLYY